MDALAKIAESFKIQNDRGLETPKPIKINEKITKLRSDSRNGFFEIHNETAADIERETVELYRYYAPFLCSYPRNRDDDKGVSVRDFLFSRNGKDFEQVTLPHYGGPADRTRVIYKSTFILEDFSDKRVLIEINGADYIAQVFINGEFAGAHEGFFAPFTIDITELARKGENELKIILLNDRTMKDGGDKIYAATGLGWDSSEDGWHHCPPGVGLYNSVNILIREKEYITDVFPRVNSKVGEIWVDCDAAGYEERDVKLLLSVYGENFEETVFENAEFVPGTVFKAGMSDTFTETIMRANGTLGSNQPLKIMNGFNRFKAPIKIENPRIWSPREPWLYRAQVSLIADGVLKSVKSKVFGIRDFEQDINSEPKGKFYLNGREIELRGANTMGYEQQDVLRGDRKQLIKDMLLAKVCNMNFLRLTQRPVQEEIYDICDRLGLMIQTDLPLFGVIRINKYYEVLREVGEMERMVRSHPCCIIDTYINEPFPNANNQPHRNINRSQLREFFAAADAAVSMENPDRVIKHIDGDYDPPDSLLPDNHCYTMWYNGHGIEAGDLHKGYWIPVKPGWHCGCGEFGSEALDFRSTMEKHYPKEWISGEFDPANIIRCQLPDFYRHFYETPDGLDGWIAESQEFQRFATRLMTSAFRRSKRINTFAIHLFIDAFPSGWMKAIVDCERNLKPAFFEYKRCLAPVFCNIRSDRFSFFGGEEIELESYLCTDMGYETDEIRYYALLDGRLIASESVVPIGGKSQGKISLKLPQISEKTNLRVYMGAFKNGELKAFVEEKFKVYPYEELKPCNIIPFSEYEKNRSYLDCSVQNGQTVIIGNMPQGNIRIGNTDVTVKLNAMNPIYFVSRDTGSKYTDGIGRNEFGWLYNSREDKITPILYSTICGDGLLPVLKTTNKSANGKWVDSLACAELPFGKGKFILLQAKLENREKNPVVVKFLNNLSEG